MAGGTYLCEHCLRGDRASGVCSRCGYDGVPRNKRDFLPEGTELVNRYQVGRSEGSGGFSVCYRAWDRQKSELIAIKELFPAKIVDRMGNRDVVVGASQRRAFLTAITGLRREAECLTRLRNEAAVVRVGEFFETNGTAYLTMEFLRGKSYYDYLFYLSDKRSSFQPVPVSVNVALSVLGSLAAIHKLGLFHLDIKPSNLRVRDDGRIVLLDFGSAREAFRRDGDAGGSYTPGYAAPEQYDPTASVSPSTDLYALGALLYFSLTLRVPPPASDRLSGQEPVPPRQINSAVPEALELVIRRAMALDPAERYQSARDFCAALEPFASPAAAPRPVDSKAASRSAALPSRARRIVSGIIDTAVLLFLPRLLETSPSSLVAFFILAALIEFLLLTFSGSTIGMILAGTRVVRVDGAKLSAGTLLLRLLVSPVAFARIPFGSRASGRMAHDIHADTEVVWRRTAM